MQIPNQKKRIFIAVIVTLTVVLTVGGYFWWQDHKEKMYPERLNEVRAAFAGNKFPEAKKLLAEMKATYGERKEILQIEGTFSLLENKGEEAKTAYTKVLEKDPNDVKTRFTLGMKLLGEGKKDEALQHAKTLEGTPEGKYLSSLIKMAEGKHKEVLADMESVAEYFKNDYAFQVNLGDVYWKTGDKKKAVPFYHNALKLNDKAWMVSLKLAEIYLAWDKYPTALGFANMSIKNEPGCLPAYKVGGEALFMEKKYDEAATYCEQILKYAEKNKNISQELQGWAQYRLGSIALAKDDKKKAQERMELAVQAQPDNPSYQSRLACVYAMNGQYEQAIKQAEQVAENNPKSDVGTTLLGQIALASGDVKLAQKSFEEALKKPGEHTSAKLILAELYLRQKEYRVAYGLLEQVNENDLRTKPQMQVYLHFKKGVILDTLGGREKFAKEEYEKCLKVDPKCVGAMANLSRILTQDKATVKDAVKYAEQAVQIKADSDDLQQILGRAYYADGQFEKSVTALQKARELNKNAPVNYPLGLALKGLGKKEEAIKELTPLLDNKDFSKKDEVKKTIEELSGKSATK